MSRHPTPRQVNAALEFYEKLGAPPEPALELSPPIPSPSPAREEVGVERDRAEEYRHACEVRYVRAMAPARRVEFLRGVADNRGEQAAERIRREL